MSCCEEAKTARKCFSECLKKECLWILLSFVIQASSLKLLYRHIDKLEKYIGIPITKLSSGYDFEYLLLEHMPKRKNPELFGRKGYSWSGPRNRWCTAMLKQRVINKYIRELSKNYTIKQYLGIAVDERYPFYLESIADSVVVVLQDVLIYEQNRSIYLPINRKPRLPTCRNLCDMFTNRILNTDVSFFISSRECIGNALLRQGDSPKKR